MHSSTICGWQTDGSFPCSQCCFPNNHAGKSVCASLEISSPKPSVDCLAPQPQAAPCFCSSAQLGASTFGPLRKDFRSLFSRCVIFNCADSICLLRSSHLRPIKSCRCKLKLVLSCAKFSAFSSSCCCCLKSLSSCFTIPGSFADCKFHIALFISKQFSVCISTQLHVTRQAQFICTQDMAYIRRARADAGWYNGRLQASCKQQSGLTNQVVCW